ncbi:MAG: MFS transporter [Acetobacteraceae bacterium]|nr:MFS transporter [Acetobacteraceae bacterium]
MAIVMYILAYVDRINVAMILPYVDQSFGLSAADSGFAAGIFFVGYMVLQIPGGILASRWSARKTVAILMVLWGVTAVATGFVQSRNQLYAARFILGIFEGGVWPAVLVLLATWFPQNERARANAFWMSCLPISAVFMAPLTGWLLNFLTWRTVFVIEGLPPLVWVFVWWFFIADRPSEAVWVSAAERDYVEGAIARENAGKPASAGIVAAMTDRTVVWLVVAYFFWMAGFYGFTMWVPAVVKGFAGPDTSSFTVGAISAIPFAFALVSMLATSAWSDRMMKRQAFVAVPAVIGAIGLIAGQFVHAPALQLMFLIIAAIGVYGPYGPFWAIPSAILRPEVTGVAMGLINMANLGGFLGPYVVGYVRTATGSGFAGFLVLAVFLLIAAGIVMMIGADKRIAALRGDRVAGEAGIRRPIGPHAHAAGD